MPEPEATVPVNDSSTATPNASAPGAAAGGENGGEPAAQLALARAEAAANYEKFLRTAADLENFRRRTVREKDDLRMTATSRVLEDVFPVLDTLAMAVAAAKQPNADVKSLVGGVDMVLSQFRAALSKHGMKEIAPARGEAFDPHQHEAISHLADAGVKEEHVLNVVRIGYALNGRLLRPAAVVVSSGPAKDGQG